MKQNEEMLLGQILTKPTIIYSLDLQADDFSDPQCKMLYPVLLDISRESEDINILKVRDRMPNINIVWLAELTDSVHSTSNYEYFYKKIKANSRELKLKHMVLRASDLLERRKAEEARLLLEDELTTLALDGFGWKTKCITEVLLRATELIEERVKNRGKLPGIDTGFTMLNSLSQGFQPRLLYLFAARPSRGKTALMLNMAMASAKHKKVGIISTESASEELGMRLLSSMSGIDSQTLKSGYIKQDEMARMSHAAGELSNRHIDIYDKPNASLDDVIFKIREWVRGQQIDVVFVDYIQNIDYTAKNTERENIGHISTKLKAEARNLNIPVVALAQLRREADGKEYRRPYPSDLLGSGKLEQDADVLGLIWWKLLNKEEFASGLKGEYEYWLNMEKMRDGETGGIRLKFIGATTTFKEIT